VGTGSPKERGKVVMQKKEGPEKVEDKGEQTAETEKKQT